MNDGVWQGGDCSGLDLLKLSVVNLLIPVAKDHMRTLFSKGINNTLHKGTNNTFFHFKLLLILFLQGVYQKRRDIFKMLRM